MLQNALILRTGPQLALLDMAQYWLTLAEQTSRTMRPFWSMRRRNHIMMQNMLCATANLDARLPKWVKTAKSTACSSTSAIPSNSDVGWQTAILRPQRQRCSFLRMSDV